MEKKEYKVAIPTYIRDYEKNEDKLQSYLSEKITINEYFYTDLGTCYFQSFKLVDIKTESKLNIQFEIKFSLKVLKDGKINSLPIRCTWTMGYVATKKDEGVFTFNERRNNGIQKVFAAQEKEFEDFDIFIIILMGAVYDYMVDNPYEPKVEEKKGWWQTTKRYAKIGGKSFVQNVLPSDTFLMLVNNVHQQVIQKSFRDIAPAEQADKNYKTTAKGLEDSLSAMSLPTGNLPIHNVELDGAFRISYTNKA